LCVAIHSHPVFGECPKGKAEKPAPTNQVRTVQFDAKRVIESLANANSPPKLVGGVEQRPVFKNGFDWSEQDRVQKAIKLLVNHAEEAWPDLVNHLDDNRYAITYHFPTFDSAENYSIGDICEQIISDSISQGYYHQLPRRSRASEQVYHLTSEPLPCKEGKLKTWCEARSKKKLYELQVEMCNWVLGEIPELTKATEDERKSAIAAIKTQIKTLETTKKPVQIDRLFRSWKAIPFTKEMVKE
jgi:hypothetical protein